MDRVEDPAATFAKKILRDHPQIAYEHAVSAATYAGVPHLSARTFFAVVDQLQIERADPDERRRAEAMALAEPAPPRSETVPSGLVEQLDRLREDVEETAALREALERMQKVVRAALEETESPR